MSRVRVTIDQLVLKGFGPADRKPLVEGLRNELSEALAAPVEWRSHRTPVLRLGQMPFDPGPSGSRKFGAGVAQAIGKRVKG